MNEIEIKPMSPTAAKFASEPRYTAVKAKYPVDTLKVGECFTLPAAEANLKSLQSITSRKSKNGKRYIVVNHDELKLVEVARIA